MKLLNVLWLVILAKRRIINAVDNKAAAYYRQHTINSLVHNNYTKFIDVNSLLRLDDITGKNLGVNSEVIIMSPESASIGTFHPLDCNANLTANPCTTKLSDIYGKNILSTLTDLPLIIPCGQCVIFDLKKDVIIAGGLNIKGKLKFQDNQKVTIHTPFVIVQGELSIKVDHDVISPDRESIAFNITGIDDVKFKPTDSPNQDACALNNGECNLGRKPFIVAGGKLNIDAFPSNCSTHTPVLDTKTADISPNKDDFPVFEPLPDSCPILGTDFIKYDFNNGSVGNWTGWWGGYVSIVDKTLKVTNRQRTDQGPYLDITSLRPALCLIPDKDYLFSVRIKFDKAGNEGLPTLCSIKG